MGMSRMRDIRDERARVKKLIEGSNKSNKPDHVSSPDDGDSTADPEGFVSFLLPLELIALRTEPKRLDPIDVHVAIADVEARDEELRGADESEVDYYFDSTLEEEEEERGEEEEERGLLLFLWCGLDDTAFSPTYPPTQTDTCRDCCLEEKG